VPVNLPPPQLLEIAGPDAIAFAHAQFTSDVAALPPERWQWSAWLSAQGRVRASFRLLRRGDSSLVLLLGKRSAEAVRAALAPYVFRSKVQLRVLPAGHAFGYFLRDEVVADFGVAPDDGPQGGAIATNAASTVIALPGAQPRWYAFGVGRSASAASAEESNRWHAADIGDGLVDLGDSLGDRYLPTWLGLDSLGAVSIGKGCYPGQEIVARLHFKGGNKRWLHRIEFSADRLPDPATQLDPFADTAGGEIVAAAWSTAPRGVGLAILPRLPHGTQLSSPALPGSSFRVVSPVRDASD